MYSKQKDGRYRTRILIGYDENGKKKYKSLYAKSPKELRLKETEFRSKLYRGLDVITQNDTLNEWIERFKPVKQTQLNEKEFYNYCHRITIFENSIGKMQLTAIRPMHIEKVIRDIYEENPYTHQPTAKKTLIYYLSNLSQVFEYAIKNLVITYNPCKYVDIPANAPKQERSALTLEYQQMIFDTENYMRLGALIMLCCGLRRGELCALTWNNIDLKNSTMTVSHSLNFVTNTIKDPKTESGNRTIPIPAILLNELIRAPKKEALVLPKKTGGQMTESAWKKAWNSYIDVLDEKYNGIERFTAHQLRHTYCTNLKDAGINVKDAQYLMGHSSIDMTLKVYTHTCDDAIKGSIHKLEDYMEKSVNER